jgi:sigma-B regulation protein RsbU (phosphoserine phosphatase)
MTNIPDQNDAGRLLMLYRITQSFNSTLDLDEVLENVIDAVIEITGAERGFLMLKDPSGELVFRVALGMDHETIEEPEFQVSRTIVQQVAESGKPLLTSNAQDDFASRASVINLKLRSILCVPLQHKGLDLGLIYVDNRIQNDIFTNAELELLAAVAASAAAAIENARLYEIAIEKGRMERELQVAQQVQSSLMPDQVPQVDGWEIAAYWNSAREVSGDFYDFFRRPDGNLGIVVADVVDKGVPAALFMAFSRSTLRASLGRQLSPAESIAEANRLIYADDAYGMYLTLAYLEVAAGSSHLTYVNAGHPPPLMRTPGQPAIVPLNRTGKLIGVLEDIEYQHKQVTVEPGSFVVLYTDGVTEATNLGGEEFGDQRLKDILLNSDPTISAEALLSAITHALDNFRSKAKQSDDITLVVLRKV